MKALIDQNMYCFVKGIFLMKNNYLVFSFMKKTVAMSSKERTLVFVKPDGVQRKLVGQILRQFENKGFDIIDLRIINLSPDFVDRHYAEHLDKPFYPELKQYILSGPVVMMILEADNAVAIARKIIGATNPIHSEPGSIRGKYSLSKGENVVHSSDSIESAVREINNYLTFKNSDYKRIDKKDNSQ